MFRKMRRSPQALSREESIELLKSETRGVMSVQGDDGYPYGFPINHYYDEETNKKKPAGKDAANGKPQKSDVKAVTDDLSKKVLFGVSYSSKKDSKATQYSKYSVETNMDIDITVGKEDMPGGISKMLEILNDSVEITDPNGVLTVTSEKVALENGKAIVKASFKNEDGIYDCSRIRCTGPATVKIVNNVEVAQLVFTTAGIYTVSAGNRNIVVDVVAGAAQTATATTNPLCRAAERTQTRWTGTRVEGGSGTELSGPQLPHL